MTTETLPSWDLTDLYSAVDDPQIHLDMDASRQQAIDFEVQFKGTIATDELTGSHLLRALQAYENLLAAEYRPQSFAQLHYSTNTEGAALGSCCRRRASSAVP